MNKIVELLEKYVQWVALGIGALVLLWAGYAYLATPTTVKVAGQEVAPGDVDKRISETVLPALENKLQQKSDAKIDVPGVNVAAILEPITSPVPLTPRSPVAPSGIASGPTTGPGETVAVGLPVDVQKPIPPKPNLDARSLGQSMVSYPDPTFKPDPRKADATAPMVEVDKDWVSFLSHIKMAQLAAAFDAAKIPPPVEQKSYPTQLLRVTLLRQEKQPDGTWGKETRVPALPGVDTDNHPLPPESPNPTTEQLRAQYEYLAWAVQNLQPLIQPTFPAVESGTPWYLPGTEAPPDIVKAAAPTGPGAPGAPGVPPAATPAAPAPAAPPAGPAGMRKYGNTWIPAPGAAGRPNPAAAPRPLPAIPPPGVPGVPGAGPDMTQLNTNLPGLNASAGDAKFDPREVTSDFDILVHDSTVEAGKTYRYRVFYTILNPLWNKADAPAAYSKQFAINSPSSDWSDEIFIPRRVEFFVTTATRRGGGDASFVLFDRKAGAYTKKEAKNVQPGDAIGDSSWVLVDVRDDGNRRPYVLVADPNGRTVRRDPQQDKVDPQYQKLLNLTGGTAMATHP